MNWPIALVIVSGLLAGALLLSGPASSQSGSPGTWAGVGMEGNWGWVVNTTTGQVKACQNSGPTLNCKLSP
jgi:hypothetical protein